MKLDEETLLIHATAGWLHGQTKVIALLAIWLPLKTNIRMKMLHILYSGKVARSKSAEKSISPIGAVLAGLCSHMWPDRCVCVYMMHL